MSKSRRLPLNKIKLNDNRPSPDCIDTMTILNKNDSENIHTAYDPSIFSDILKAVPLNSIQNEKLSLYDFDSDDDFSDKECWQPLCESYNSWSLGQSTDSFFSWTDELESDNTKKVAKMFNEFEESLYEDNFVSNSLTKELLNESEDWKTKFPHFRIVGNSYDSNADPKNSLSDEENSLQEDEIFAEHHSPEPSRKELKEPAFFIEQHSQCYDDITLGWQRESSFSELGIKTKEAVFDKLFTIIWERTLKHLQTQLISSLIIPEGLSDNINSNQRLKPEKGNINTQRQRFTLPIVHVPKPLETKEKPEIHLPLRMYKSATAAERRNLNKNISERRYSSVLSRRDSTRTLKPLDERRLSLPKPDPNIKFTRHEALPPLGSRSLSPLPIANPSPIKNNINVLTENQLTKNSSPKDSFNSNTYQLENFHNINSSIENSMMSPRPLNKYSERNIRVLSRTEEPFILGSMPVQIYKRETQTLRRNIFQNLLQ